uniref:Exonuclease domain-containing protein n=1 Tax=Noctiluca scintillans TaxID=2966 RepID=A0A7S1FAB9_NOCSC|mmetsp:Transcript_44483/g.118120  ORF Transcript_44483/g.118120 Transcript_44483/m.118120 type:complete len:274 (+) Transcript_44483:56-877(+)
MWIYCGWTLFVLAVVRFLTLSLQRWQRRDGGKLRDVQVTEPAGDAVPSTSAADLATSSSSETAVEATVDDKNNQVPFDYYAVVDFECTCDQGEWPAHEIIEFPAVFVNARTRKVDMEFHRYVRCAENPRLTPFCTELTGITQEDVDSAERLPVVLQQFQEFLDSHGLVTRRRERSPSRPLFVICTDGPWDIRKFLRPEAGRKRLHLEHCWNRWVDVRRTFETRRGLRCGVVPMLQHMGLAFEGREHSGLDDARNIARILIVLLESGHLEPHSF